MCVCIHVCRYARRAHPALRRLHRLRAPRERARGGGALRARGVQSRPADGGRGGAALLEAAGRIGGGAKYLFSDGLRYLHDQRYPNPDRQVCDYEDASTSDAESASVPLRQFERQLFEERRSFRSAAQWEAEGLDTGGLGGGPPKVKKEKKEKQKEKKEKQEDGKAQKAGDGDGEAAEVVGEAAVADAPAALMAELEMARRRVQELARPTHSALPTPCTFPHCTADSVCSVCGTGARDSARGGTGRRTCAGRTLVASRSRAA